MKIKADYDAIVLEGSVTKDIELKA